MQVISNLLTNSIYAMPAGGNLRITVKDTREQETGVLLTIADNRSGIPEENLPHIFEAFFTTRRTIGTSIGLFIA